MRLAIELDDRSHHRQRAQDRDQFVDDALRAAGIPILRVPAQQAYDVEGLGKAICRMITLPAVKA